jgi:hypothetical protein
MASGVVWLTSAFLRALCVFALKGVPLGTVSLRFNDFPRIV